MNKCLLYTQERTTFLSVCDEWYKVLEPQGLMTNRERKLLQNWIIERQYANIEDSIVSLMIDKCSTPKKEEKKRKKEEAMQRKKRRHLGFERIEQSRKNRELERIKKEAEFKRIEEDARTEQKNP